MNAIAAMNDSDARLLAELNALPKGEARLFAGTVIRHRGRDYFLMNRQAEGWASTARRYATLFEIARLYALDFVAVGQDEYSWFIQVEPHQAKPVAC